MSRTLDVMLDDALWADVEAGTEALVEEWLVSPGATVQAGQHLATVVLVKSSHEVTAPCAGVLEAIAVPPEATFARGVALATVREA
jgi:pyruvate/2-oxoglutarate dehydrogenase complex dihydrolipoamide acyltransferase (E2) component